MELLNEKAIERLGWASLLEALETAFSARASNPHVFLMPERVAIELAAKSYLTMPCADQEGWFGVKQVAVIADNPAQHLPSVQAWYTLMNPAGQAALACDAGLLTRYRTAAVSALAARYLAPENAHTLLLVGTGSLAPFMAEAHAQVRSFEQVLVWGRDFSKARALAAVIAKRFEARGLSSYVRPIERLSTAVTLADVVTVATTARQPVLQGDWLSSGQHIDLVGAFTPEMAELDAAGIMRSSVFVDDLTAAQAEAGDLIQAASQDWSFEYVQGELTALVTQQAGRKSSEDITLFKSVGLALEDLVVAKLLLAQAMT